MHNVERGSRWAASALAEEIKHIEALPAEERISKPGSGFWHAIYRIAGLVNGGFLDSYDALLQIKYAARHMRVQARDIDYQWRKALQKAPARQPK